MKTAITGATGQLGTSVVQELKKRIAPENIVALVRTPEKASSLGIEARAFDYEKKETLATALKDVETLLLISSNVIGQRAAQHSNVIEAAKAAGVKWIVYTSLLHADSSSLSLAQEHLDTEKMIKESGIAYTILRNGWYTENYTGSVSSALAGGAVIGSAGTGKISSATRADFAEAAAIVLAEQTHKGKVYELAGDESYTLSDLAAEVSNQSGQKIIYRDLPVGEYAKILESFGLDEGFANAITGWDVSASEGALFDNSYQLSKLLGRATKSLSESVKEALA